MIAEQETLSNLRTDRTPSFVLAGVNLTVLAVISSLAIAFGNNNSTIALYILIAVLIQVAFIAGMIGKVVALSLLLLVVVQPISVPLLHQDYLTLPPDLDLSFEMDTRLFSGIQGTTRVRTDGNGYRIAGDYHDPDGFRVFAVGASTTEQLYLDEDETSFALLAQQLGPDVSVVNTGLAGTRAVNHIATIDFISRYQPDLILILVGINDWNCAIRKTCGGESWWNPDAWVLTRAARRVYRAVRPAWTEEEIAFGGPQPFDEYHSAVMGRYDDKEKKPLEEMGDLLEAYRADFSELNQACARTEAFCLFLTQPTSYRKENFESEQYRRSLWMTPPNEEWALPPEDLREVAQIFNDYLLESVTCNDCGALDLDALMEGRTEYFYDDVHFTELGAERVAEILGEFIRGTRLRDWSP